MEKRTYKERLPSGSVIHWDERDPKNRMRVKVTCGGCGKNRMVKPEPRHRFTGMCYECAHGKALTDEKLPSGSIIHWTQREGSRVPVTCGRCGAKRVRSAVAKRNFTGLCRGHSRVKLAKDEKLPSGSIIHWARQNRQAKKVWFTCGQCGTEWLRRIQAPEKRRKWTFCRECMGKQFTRDEVRPSGTIIHWSSRDLTNNQKVEITCRGCRQRSTTWTHNVRRDSWSELCPDCMRKQDPYNKRLSDEVLSSGTIIHWGEPDPSNRDERVIVTCGLCRWRRSASKLTLYSGHRKITWTGYCPERFDCLKRVQANLSSLSKIGRRRESATNSAPRLEDVPKLLEEIKPLILEAKKIYKRDPFNWRSEVEKKFPQLVAEAVSMVPAYAPNKIQWQQVARTWFDCAGRTLEEKHSKFIREQVQQAQQIQ